jgi:hypothetical protein
VQEPAAALAQPAGDVRPFFRAELASVVAAARAAGGRGGHGAHPMPDSQRPTAPSQIPAAKQNSARRPIAARSCSISGPAPQFDNNSPADVAVQVWLQAPRVLEELHAENYTVRQKNFCCFGGRSAGPRAFPKAPDTALGALERDLDEGFEEYQRGRGCRVFIFDHGRKVWILARRGATFRREESMKDGGQPGVQFYRPMMYDVLVYDTETDDLGLHVETRWQERMYLSCIGQHLFRDPQYFPSARMLTFDPIIKRGADALHCADVPGMREVKLVEVNRKWNNTQHEIDIKKADDLFALGDRARSFLQNGTLTKLVFRVWFEGDNKPRSVTVRWPNITKYERDGDSELIERWLSLRGFMLRNEQARDAAD